MPMDYHKWMEQDAKKHQEEANQRSLEQARSGEMALARATGLEAVGLTKPTASAPTGPAPSGFLSGATRPKEEETPTALVRGGLAKARRPYLVGEKGPELMVPDQNGRIIPNHKLKSLVKAVPRAQGGRVSAGGSTGRAAELVQAGVELGAPTSYAGGAGAPVPAEVVRGTRTTYTNPAPSSGEGGYNPTLSRNTREFATPVQAGQAFNRGQFNQDLALARQTPGVTPNLPALKEKFGEYVPAGGPLEDIKGKYHVESYAAYNRRPDLIQASEKAAKDEATNAAHATFTNYLTTAHPGVVDGKAVFKPKDEGMQVDAIAAKGMYAQGGPAMIQHFDERQQVREFIRNQMPEVKDISGYITSMAQNPKSWANLTTAAKPRKITEPAKPPPVNWKSGIGALQGAVGRGISAGSTDFQGP